MSSFSGSVTPTGVSADPDLQQISTEKGPDFGTLKQAFEDAVADNSLYRDICEQNAQTRFAQWPGQSSDGRKHARDNGKTEPTPWDGASDLQVFLADEAINSYVAVECLAAQKAHIVAIPVEGNDNKRAKNVSNFMRWLLKTQIVDFDREMELLSNYVHEKGLALTGQFWEVKQDKILTKIRLDEFQAQYPQVDMQALLNVDSLEDDLLALFEEIFGCTRKKAKKMVAELRESGETTVPTVGKAKSRPVLRAFNLDEDIFVASNTADLEDAAGIYRVQYFTPEKLRCFVHTDGWNEAWVEAAIDRCIGTQVTLTATGERTIGSRTATLDQNSYKGKIGVVYAYQRLSDEDGYGGIYCTQFNPNLGPEKGHEGYAKHALLGYAHGQYPFVLHRREYLSRKLYDSRGIPEPAKPIQNQIKVHRDSRIDAASVAILPPLMHPVGRPPHRWGAGARVPERRPGEYHYSDRPVPDLNTEKSEELLRGDWNKYVGFVSREEDPIFNSVLPQFQVNKRLSGLSKAFGQIWSLYKQMGEEKVYYRVIGSRQEDPVLFERGPQEEEFDFFLSWDVQSMDPERQEKKLEALARVIMTFDKHGQVDFSEALQIAVEIVDPNWAERIIQPKEVGTQKVVNETNTMIAQIAAGVSRDIDLGAPAEMVLQILQGYASQPDVQQRIANDQPFRERLEKVAKQSQHQIDQLENKRIGVYGQ
jgi:hypothetical protein